MKISTKLLFSLVVSFLLSACSANNPLGVGHDYDYKRMVMPVTWGESEFKVAWVVGSGTYNEPAKQYRWVRVGGPDTSAGIPGVRPQLTGYATVKEGLPTLGRGDLVEFLTSELYEVNLDTQAGTAVVVRLVCKSDDRACIKVEQGKTSGVVTGSTSKEEWTSVPRAKRL